MLLELSFGFNTKTKTDKPEPWSEVDYLPRLLFNPVWPHLKSDPNTFLRILEGNSSNTIKYLPSITCMPHLTLLHITLPYNSKTSWKCEYNKDVPSLEMFTRGSCPVLGPKSADISSTPTANSCNTVVATTQQKQSYTAVSLSCNKTRHRQVVTLIFIRWPIFRMSSVVLVGGPAMVAITPLQIVK